MFQNYLKIVLRNLSRNKFYFTVNVMGLGVALGCCIIALLNYTFDRDFDTMHQNAAQIYRVTSVKASTGQEYGISPAPLALVTKQDIPEIEKTLSWHPTGMTIKSGDQVFGENVHFATKEVSDFFTFPLLQGDLSALDKEVTVGAVIEDHPKNSSIWGGFISHPDNNFREGKQNDPTDWKKSIGATFLKINNPADVANVTKQLQKYIPIQNKSREDWPIKRFQLQPFLETAHLGESMNQNYLNTAFPPVAAYGPAIMALLLLLTACLNFANTSISFSGKRLKEMGVRKVMGGTRRQLVGQLLAESFAISFIALLIGMVVADWLLPLYNAMWEYLHLDTNYFNNPELLGYLVIILLITTLIAGAYPAFYISGFNASSIFRGSVKFGGSNLLSRVLLGIQIAISLTAVIGAFAFLKNATFQENIDLGYNRDQIMGVRFYNGQNDMLKTFKNAARQNPKIQQAISTQDHPGYRYWGTDITSKDLVRECGVFSLGKDYFEMMDFKLIKGNGFDTKLEVDNKNILVNQRLVDNFGWNEPIGQKVVIDSINYNVAGIVDDFIQSDLFTEKQPVAMRMLPEKDHLFLIIKTDQKNMLAVNKDLKKTWNNLFPFIPFNSFYQNELLAESLEVSRNVKRIFAFLAIVSVLLTTIGLLALVSLSILKRQKEIAVRKVLGASLANISYLINKHYIWIFILSAIAGSLMGGFFADLLISEIFQIYQPFNYSTALIASAILFIISGSIIAYKIFEIARSNPSDVLKTE